MAARSVGVGDETRWLVVRAGGSCYGLPASIVRHVIRDVTCHPVPGSLPRFVGLAQFAGEPLAVVDLYAVAEGGTARSSRGVVLIVADPSEHSVATLGVAADAALRVVSVDAEPTELANGGRRSVTVDGETVKLLQPEVVMMRTRGHEGRRNG